MLAIPPAVRDQFEHYLQNKAVPTNLREIYTKWLRYYLDFCGKYSFPPAHKESLPNFIRKLQEKKQTKVQQEQAETAITMYYQIVKSISFFNKEPLPVPTPPSGYPPLTKRNASLSVRSQADRFNIEKAYQHRLQALPLSQEGLVPPKAFPHPSKFLLNLLNPIGKAELPGKTNTPDWPMRSRFAIILPKPSRPTGDGSKNFRPLRTAKGRNCSPPAT
jgi:hypothetical protein